MNHTPAVSEQEPTAPTQPMLINASMQIQATVHIHRQPPGTPQGAPSAPPHEQTHSPLPETPETPESASSTQQTQPLTPEQEQTAEPPSPSTQNQLMTITTGTAPSLSATQACIFMLEYWVPAYNKIIAAAPCYNWPVAMMYILQFTAPPSSNDDTIPLEHNLQAALTQYTDTAMLRQRAADTLADCLELFPMVFPVGLPQPITFDQDGNIVQQRVDVAEGTTPIQWPSYYKLPESARGAHVPFVHYLQDFLGFLHWIRDNWFSKRYSPFPQHPYAPPSLACFPVFTEEAYEAMYAHHQLPDERQTRSSRTLLDI
ncbi:hypothetical protein BC940DRAFT_289019 [Gongronella butleri]|nr:hypothetical protein BC940DRAFT_289019 [Gongronella butleri]